MTYKKVPHPTALNISCCGVWCVLDSIREDALPYSMLLHLVQKGCEAECLSAIETLGGYLGTLVGIAWSTRQNDVADILFGHERDFAFAVGLHLDVGAIGTYNANKGVGHRVNLWNVGSFGDLLCSFDTCDARCGGRLLGCGLPCFGCCGLRARGCGCFGACFGACFCCRLGGLGRLA